MDYQKFLHNVAYTLALLAASAAVLGIGICLVKIATANGEVDYCYIDNGIGVNSTKNCVYEHRSWSRDRLAGCFLEPRDTVALAESMGCPLVKK